MFMQLMNQLIVCLLALFFVFRDNKEAQAKKFY